MATFFAGMRGTGDFGTDERPKNFREMILWTNPSGSAPLFALMSKMKKETTDDPEIAWWEETKDSTYAYIDGAIADTAETTLVVDDGVNATDWAYRFQVGDVLELHEGAEDAGHTWELVKVTSITNGTTLEVEREYANTTAAALSDNTYILKVGSAFAEGTGSPGSALSNPTKYINYTQIFKTPYDITGTAKSTRFRTGDPLKNDQIRKSFTHSAAIEWAMLYGKAHETTGANGKPERTMGGLRRMIQSNVTVFGATPTLDTFEAAISPCFDYEAGSAGNERLVFAGNGALNFLNKLCRNASGVSLQYEGPIDWYGMRLRTYTLPQGTLHVKSHPLMNVNDSYTYSMFGVNPSGLIYRPLKDRDTKVQKNIQANDADLQKDQWLTEATIELHYERSFFYLGEFKDQS